MKPDVDRLYRKYQTFGDSIEERRQTVERVKEFNKSKLRQTRAALESSAAKSSDNSPERGQENHERNRNSKEPAKKLDKNPTVGDVDKMMFDKKFKNYLNHRQEFREMAKKRRERILQQRKEKVRLEPGQDYFNEQEVLSNADSDYQYADASDMHAAYQQIATGKKHKKGGVKLFHSQKIEFCLRLSEFQALSELQQTEGLISKGLFLDYLFEEPCIMMLYSINPYALADELADFETKTLEVLSFEEFSSFLLQDREPTYFEYSKENLEEARKIGRGLKCSAIVGKWIGYEGFLEWIIDIFRSVDIFGNGEVDRQVLAKKLYRQAENKRLLDAEVIQVVNISKMIPLRRLLFEIQHQESDRVFWSIQQFTEYLQNYKRLSTPSKDKIIMKLIMAGKFDPSYIYVVSGEVLDIIKEVFSTTQKFAECFVMREKFIGRLCSDPRYPRIRSLFVRSQANRYVQKESVEETLIRMNSQADDYIDIEEILDFFTNRGRPNLVEYRVYLANLERQLQLIKYEEMERVQRIEDGGVSSSDQEYARQLKDRKIKRKQAKLATIHSSNNYTASKKFNVTIPVGFQFDSRKKTVSIRQLKVKEMLEEKRHKEDEAMQPIRPRQVPRHVKEHLFERIMKDQERVRLERLQKFKLEIMNSMVPMSKHLVAPKHITPHCDFSREEYKFVARPMPWYCEVNLMDRMNRKKQDRRERILETIINRNNDYDLPWGVQQMMDRLKVLDDKRQARKDSQTTGTAGWSFIPKISREVPDFKTMHEHLKMDLEEEKEKHVMVVPQPFSFENRPKKARTTYEERKPHRHLSPSRERPLEEAEINIPVTMKYQALVDLRRRQAEQKKKKKDEEDRANQIRKLRKDKFAPYVRAVLRKNDHDLGRSRQQIEEKIREFQRDERVKKEEYEKEMIKIYTKVFNRPLLVETMGQFGENEMKKVSKFSEDQQVNQRREQKRVEKPRGRGKQKFVEDRYAEENYAEDYDQKRKRAVEQEPGQYPMEGGYQEDDRYDEMNFEKEFMSEQGHYTS